MKKIVGLIVGLSVLVPSFALASVNITLSGGNVTANQGSLFVEPGYSAVSSFDGNITNQVQVSGNSTSQVGHFTVNYSVIDSNLDTAFASRDLTVTGSGAGMIFCSGPLAPGWNVSESNGGCGGTKQYIQFGAPLADKLGGVGGRCDFVFGCMIN